MERSPATRRRRSNPHRGAAVRRRRALALLLLITASLVGLGLGISAASPGAERTRSSTSTTSRQAERRCTPPPMERPAWIRARRATLVVDSVLLGAVPAVRSNLSGWEVGQRGRPAVMLPAITGEIAEARTGVAPLAIVGVGYNSLWQRDRARYRVWAAAFDRDAQRLIATLKRRGAEQIVWVTLRQARLAAIPSNSLWQFRDYAWYFPYVNERLRRLDRLRGDVTLADWARVSNRPGLTYDAIHLDPDGQRLMARTIRSAIEREALHQVARTRETARRVCATAEAPAPD